MNANQKSLLLAKAILLCTLLPSARAGLKLTNIHSFNDAYWPFCALVQAPNGAFYGTTLLGGAYQSGTVFKISPNPVPSRGSLPFSPPTGSNRSPV